VEWRPWIPDYRLPRNIVGYEAGLVKELGVEIRYNTQVGKDITISQMFEQGYKAIFVGVGAQTNTPMGVEGEDKGYQGFIPGVYYSWRSIWEETPILKEEGWSWSVVETWPSTVCDLLSA